MARGGGGGGGPLLKDQCSGQSIGSVGAKKTLAVAGGADVGISFTKIAQEDLVSPA